jgi:uncharacterized protein (DUF1330 family)
MAAYFLWHNCILDAEKMNQYLSKVLVTMAPYHPEVVVFDEQAHALEGSAPGPRTIVIKFDSRHRDGLVQLPGIPGVSPAAPCRD